MTATTDGIGRHDRPISLLRRNAAALVVGGAVSLFGIPAVSLLAGGSEGGLEATILIALAASIIWVSIAAPMLAVRARSLPGALLRGGVIIDGAGVGMIVVAVVLAVRGQSGFSLLAVLKAYCTLLTIGLTGMGLVWIGKSETVRFALAMAAAGGSMAMLATPFWVEGMLQSASREGAYGLAAFATQWNPFYSLAAAVGYSWSTAGRMYTITSIGENVPAPPIHWYSAATRWGLLTCGVWTVAAASAIARRWRNRSRTSI